jgi:hypothetical protein
MTRRRLRRFALVMGGLAAALAGGFVAHPVSARPPGYALGSALVWHVEVAALLFVAIYGAIVTARLAYHGLTFTYVGSRGVDIPQRREVERSGADAQMSDRGVVATLRVLEGTVLQIQEHMHRLQHAHDVLLNRKEGGT